MPMTAAERAQRYREKLKENQGKYAEHKHKDRQRKLRQRLTLTNKQNENVWHVSCETNDVVHKRPSLTTLLQSRL